MLDIFAVKDGKLLPELSISEAFGHANLNEGCVWIALSDPSEVEIAELSQELQIHELHLEDIRHASSFPKCDNHNSYRFATLLSPRTAVPRNAKFAQRELDFVVIPSLIITVQTEKLQVTQLFSDRLSQDHELLNRPVDFATHYLMDALVDRYLLAAESISQRSEELYDKVLQGEVSLECFDDILDLRYSGTALNTVVLRSSEVIRKFRWGDGPKTFQIESEVYYDDLIDHLDRVKDMLKSVAGRLRDACDLYRVREVKRGYTLATNIAFAAGSLLLLLGLLCLLAFILSGK